MISNNINTFFSKVLAFRNEECLSKGAKPDSPLLSAGFVVLRDFFTTVRRTSIFKKLLSLKLRSIRYTKRTLNLTSMEKQLSKRRKGN